MKLSSLFTTIFLSCSLIVPRSLVICNRNHGQNEHINSIKIIHLKMSSFSHRKWPDNCYVCRRLIANEGFSTHFSTSTEHENWITQLWNRNKIVFHVCAPFNSTDGSDRKLKKKKNQKQERNKAKQMNSQRRRNCLCFAACVFVSIYVQQTVKKKSLFAHGAIAYETIALTTSSVAMDAWENFQCFFTV